MDANKKTIASLALLLGFCLTACRQETTPEQRATTEKPPTIVKLKKSAEPELKLPGIKELSALVRPLSKLVPESITEAMKLRQTFLDGKETESQASAIQKLSGSFATFYRDAEENGLPPGIPVLFDFSNIDFESAIRGTETCPNATGTFGAFTGKWYGRWAEMEVDHHWSRVIKPKEHAFTIDFSEWRIAEKSVQIGWQYAWIGDGYGVNHCVGFTEQGKTKRFILGYTEHLEGGDFKKIAARRPHVGIYAGSGKLIWITAREVFFEETHSNEDGELDSYSIIGFNYAKESGNGKVEFVVRDGFVAEYSTDPNHRVPFVKLALAGSVEPQELELRAQ